MMADGRPRVARRTSSQAMTLMQTLSAPVTAAASARAAWHRCAPTAISATASWATHTALTAERDGDGEAAQLLDLAGAELEAEQRAAMQPAHHEQRDQGDQVDQPAAQRLGDAGQRAAEHADHQQQADQRAVEQRDQDQRPLAAALLGV